jgi:nitroimidazol reductase NimA-like FMN-containing flavoprotein (pyridoxamine 5'-phosphate oxidase superfamily)
VQLLGKLEIKSSEKITQFLNQEHVGRIASIDNQGYPQVIPMNFVFFDKSIYMHSHIKGEKLENIKRNQKVGFEVDRELEFLSSYFEDPKDASLADTLYISVIIKGHASIVQDNIEKTAALNALMEKYQPEGGYEKINPKMPVLDHVSVIKIVPNLITGKYKIGQTLSQQDRLKLAKQILERKTPSAKETLRIMGFEITPNNELKVSDTTIW